MRILCTPSESGRSTTYQSSRTSTAELRTHTQRALPTGRAARFARNAHARMSARTPRPHQTPTRTPTRRQSFPSILESSAC
jgi:hypothetical protein